MEASLVQPIGINQDVMPCPITIPRTGIIVDKIADRGTRLKNVAEEHDRSGHLISPSDTSLVQPIGANRDATPCPITIPRTGIIVDKVADCGTRLASRLQTPA